MLKKLAGLCVLVGAPFSAHAIPIAPGQTVRMDYDFSGATLQLPFTQLTLQTDYEGDLVDPGEGYHWDWFDSGDLLLGSGSYLNSDGFNLSYGGVGTVALGTTSDLIGHVLLTWDFGTANFFDSVPLQFLTGIRRDENGDIVSSVTVITDPTYVTSESSVGVPEPGVAMLALLGLGMVGLRARRRLILSF